MQTRVNQACEAYGDVVRALAVHIDLDRLDKRQIALVDQTNIAIKPLCDGETLLSADSVLDQVQAALVVMALERKKADANVS